MSTMANPQAHDFADRLVLDTEAPPQPTDHLAVADARMTPGPAPLMSEHNLNSSGGEDNLERQAAAARVYLNRSAANPFVPANEQADYGNTLRNLVNASVGVIQGPDVRAEVIPPTPPPMEWFGGEGELRRAVNPRMQNVSAPE